MVSAELALSIPAVLLVLALALAGLGLAVDQVRSEDAARVAARAASRGDGTGQVVRLARDRAPEGALVELSTSGEGVVVEVLAPPRSRWLPGLPQARARAEARWEPGAEP